MFTLLLNSLLVFASQSNPCPNLAGSYRCQDTNEIVIRQELISGMTIYNIKDESGETHVPTDDILYPFEGGQNSNLVTGTARHFCQAGAFHIQMKGQNQGPNKIVIDDWDITQTLLLDDKKNLIHRMTGYYKHDSQKNIINEQSLCLRVEQY